MSPYKMSKIESSVRTVIDFNAAFNQRDVASMLALVGEACVLESFDPAPDGTVYIGKEAVTRYWRAFLDKLPEAQIEIEDIFGLGKRCVMGWKLEWVDGAGRSGSLRGVDIFRVQDGLIQEQLSYVKGRYETQDQAP